MWPGGTTGFICGSLPTLRLFLPYSTNCMASIPGLSICQEPPGQAGPDTIGLCTDSSGDETLVSIDSKTGAIVTIADRLTQTSPAYPHVAAGTIVGSSTFLSG